MILKSSSSCQMWFLNFLYCDLSGGSEELKIYEVCFITSTASVHLRLSATVYLLQSVPVLRTADCSGWNDFAQINVNIVV